MNHVFDVAIIGAGAMGSAAAYHLSKSAASVIVFDQYSPPHSLGSSHGESRIIREAYFESPMYVPLVRMAYQLWGELEKESGKKLFLKTGGLMLGHKDDKVFKGASVSAKEYGISSELISSDEIARQFPAFKPTKDTIALFERNAGILLPEECIKAHLELARKSSAHFHFNESVHRIDSKNGEIEIFTNKGNYLAHKIILSTGAWINSLIPELHLPLTVKRQVLFWFKYPNEDAAKFQPDHLPIYIWEYEKNKIFYGFPDLGSGLKIAIHHEGKLTAAETIDRKVEQEEIDQLAELIENHFNTKATFSHSIVCMYTNTPDENFIIDYHPSNQNIIIASPCSGHGFKFSSAIGKILSEMVMRKPLSFDIKPFSITRFI
jgi:sarcosine oxidase